MKTIESDPSFENVVDTKIENVVDTKIPSQIIVTVNQNQDEEDNQANVNDTISITNAYNAAEDVGKLVDIPFLDNYPFEFDQFVNDEGLTYSERDREKWITVTEKHIPSGTKLSKEYAVARCEFLGIATSSENVAEQLRHLNLHKDKYYSVCKNFLECYFVTLANELSITYDGGKSIEIWSHITNAFCQCKSREETEKFLVLLYISFDFIDRYKEKLTNAVLRQIGLRVVKNKNTKKKITVFESITTVILNGFRKSLNRNGPSTCGWTLTNIRPGYVLNEAEEKDYREPKKIYNWMINGKKVSISLI